MKNVVFDIIVAVCPRTDYTIGDNNDLPWPKIKKDMEHFKNITTKAKKGKYNAVIMGRKTWESIPKKFRPLKDRFNVILTRNTNYQLDDNNVIVLHTLDDALNHVGSKNEIDNIFIIGGASLYVKTIYDPRLRYAYITEIHDIFYGNTKCEELSEFHPNLYRLIYEKDVKVPELQYPITFKKYQSFNHDEQAYQNLIKHILKKGLTRNDRTGMYVYIYIQKTLPIKIKIRCGDIKCICTTTITI